MIYNWIQPWKKGFQKIVLIWVIIFDSMIEYSEDIV